MERQLLRRGCAAGSLNLTFRRCAAAHINYVISLSGDSMGRTRWRQGNGNNTLPSCVKRKTNLMPLILLFIQYSFNAQHVSAVNTIIFRSLRLTGCYCMGGIWFGVCGVPFQCGYGGVVSLCSLNH